MKRKILGARPQRSLLVFAVAVFFFISLQAIVLPSLFSGKYSRVEAATTSENKASQAAQDYCDNISPGATDAHSACMGKFKAYYLGDPPGPDCPGNDTNYQWCAGAPKAARQAASNAFPDFDKLCPAFISNAKGGDWPDFSNLQGDDKQKAIAQCNKGLGQGYAYSSGAYPDTASCDPGNVDKKDIMLQACYAGRSLADAHIFTPSEATAVARSGSLPKTDNGNHAAGGGGGGGPSATTCDSGSFSLNWILCPVFDGVQGVTQWIFNNLIQPLLMTNPICLDASTNPACDNTIYKVWSGFRIYGDIFLVIVLLVIVFGESIGGGMIDAYTAKKVLPRLLAAAVLINLSIYIMAFAIDITNVVGGGLGQLLTAPLGANGFYKIQPSGIEQAEIFGGAATAGLLAGAFVISTTGVVLLVLGLAITGIIAIVGVFITLIIRQAIIVALLLISPVAFALWCLPNTQQWFKRWWDTFFQMLLVYPMIIMAFAVADILGSITANNQGGGSSALNDIVAFMLLIIPLYMIPFMLRSSNRMLGAVQGAVSNVGRQINAVSGRRLISASGQEAGKVFSKRRAGEGRFPNAQEGSLRDRLNKGISRAANIDALGRSGLRSSLRPGGIRGDLDAAVIANKKQARNKLAEESTAFQTFSGNDDMLEAAGILYHDGEQAARTRLARGGITDTQQQNAAIAQLRAAQKQMGGQNLALTSAVARAATGTADPNGPGSLYDSIIRASDGDMLTAGSAYAEARGGLEKARRFDELEGFASAMEHMGAINDSTTASQRSLQIQRANEEGAANALEIQGMGAIVGGRGQSARNFGPALQQRIQDATMAYHDAQAQGTTTIRRYNPETEQIEDATITADEAQRNWIQVMASTSAAIDNSGGAPAEIQRMLADTVHNGNVDLTQFPPEMRDILARNPDGTRTTATTIPLSTAMSNLEDQEAFGQIKKVYGQRFQADAAAAAAAGGATPGAPPAGGAPPVVPTT